MMLLGTLSKLQLADDISDRRASCPNTDTEEQTHTRQHHPPLRATKSLNSSPTVRFKLGIPLGSLTAQLASKSFWNTDMLKTSMEQIAQCAVQEVSCLGSSLESLHNSDEEYSDRELIQVSEEESVLDLNESTCALEGVAPEDRELKNPYTVFLDRKSKGYQTPPYLSPGITRRVLSSCINIRDS